MGNPKVEKNLVRALITDFEVIVRKGIASGNLVAAHMMVSTNWLPVFDLGSGPTQSTITWENGSSMTGIGQRGAGGMTWFGFPVTWQV